MKYYFSEIGEEFCYSEESILEMMEEDGVELLEITEAKRETGSDFFYCKHYQEVGEKGECGRICDHYKPRNGKNGICVHWGYTYEPTEIKKVLRIDA